MLSFNYVKSIDTVIRRIVIKFLCLLSHFAVFTPSIEATVCFKQTDQKQVLVTNFDHLNLWSC